MIDLKQIQKDVYQNKFDKGFNVNTEDFDFENMYQIMFRIEK